MKISKNDPKALKKKIQELEAKLQQSEHENTSSASRLNVISGNEDEVYNRLVNAYSNTQRNEVQYLYFGAYYSEAINECKQGLEKELLNMDNLNEEVIQRISDYINKKQIFNDFSPTDSAKAGIFLTKLIEISPLTEITLKLERGSGIDCFGYGFAGKKKIIVDGDLGNRIGYCMKSGELEINGNVFGICGVDMRSGSIKIKGNARGDIGKRMKGGEIEIGGNAKGYVAQDMKGGTIHINGDQKPKLHTKKHWWGGETITKKGGSVYHKERLLG